MCWMTMAAAPFLAALATPSADTVSVASSASTRTGRRPAWTIAWTAPQKVSVGVSTGAPGGRPRAVSAIWMAAVHELTATVYGAPTQLPNSCSNATDSAPVVTQPLARTRNAACCAPGVIWVRQKGTGSALMGWPARIARAGRRHQIPGRPR